MESRCKEVCATCEQMLSEVYGKYAALKESFTGLSNCTPDMIWSKDLDGVYTYANSRVAYQLYRTNVANMLGKTDVELAAECKVRFGDRGFTFGEMCTGSDKVVLKEQKSMKFLERGLIDGEELVLMVNKNVKRNLVGDTVGTVGIGRDVTDHVQDLESIMDSTTDDDTRKAVKKLLDKNYYKNVDKG